MEKGLFSYLRARDSTSQGPKPQKMCATSARNVARGAAQTPPASSRLPGARPRRRREEPRRTKSRRIKKGLFSIHASMNRPPQDHRASEDVRSKHTQRGTGAQRLTQPASSHLSRDRPRQQGKTQRRTKKSCRAKTSQQTLTKWVRPSVSPQQSALIAQLQMAIKATRNAL